MSPADHKNVGRTVLRPEWPEPIYLTCHACGQEFVQFPTEKRSTLICCEACIMTNYDAWFAAYCPEPSDKAAKSGKASDGKPRKAIRAARSAVEKAQGKVASIQEQIIALQAAMAANIAGEAK